MTKQTFERIAEYIQTSDLPRKERKLDGLRTAYVKQHPLEFADGMLLLNGIAIDPSELEDGYWL